MIDSRLSAVADLVRSGTRFADVGTDHAYLPVFLLRNGKIEYAVCSDLRKGPLKNAEETVNKYGVADRVDLRLSDGLDAYADGEVNEIAIAGMGGLLMSEFIERTEWLKNTDIHLILQPMTHAEDLRKTLYENGFYIDKEVAVKDGDKLYIILSAYFCGIAETRTAPECVIGEIYKNTDSVSKEYLESLLKKYTVKYEMLKKAEKDFTESELIVKELRQWLK